MKKNYIKLAIIIFFIALLTLLICNLYKNYEGSKTNSSYISSYVSTIQYDELKNAILEFSGDTFVYISYTGDKEIYNLEKDLRKIIKSHNLEEKFLYVDATKLTKTDDYMKEINNTILTGSSNIRNIPAIIYFKDNKPIERIDSGDSLLQAAQFEQLLEKQEIVSDKK